MQLTTQALKEDNLTMLIGVGGPMEAVSAALIAAPFSPNDQTTKAELDAVAATFAGSAPKVITWSGLIVASNRQVFVQSQSLLWIATATPASPETIYGVYYYTGADLKGVDMFATPVEIDEILDSVQWIATFP